MGNSAEKAQEQAERAAREAEGRAREQALRDSIQRRKSEVFAETEGQGVGQLGGISLDIDDEMEEEELARGLSI